MLARSNRWRLRWLLAGVAALVVVGLFAGIGWLLLALRPVDADSNDSVSYVLAEGIGAEEVARQLDEKGLIRSRSAFVVYTTVTGLRRQLQAGSYELSPSDSSSDIARLLADGKIAANHLVVPDGVTVERVRQIAVERGVDGAQFDAALAATDYTSSALASRPAGVPIEGYLYPDSYTLPKPAQARELIQAMLTNLDQKIAEHDLVNKFAARGLSLHQGLTLASIVEKEEADDADRKMVAQVFFNRLKIGQRLESDPTTAYAANLVGREFNLSLDSPYNTYRAAGLPPGPICNPSLSAMLAVANPTPNDYFYFVAGRDGVTRFSKTFAEHDAKVQQHLR